MHEQVVLDDVWAFNWHVALCSPPWGPLHMASFLSYSMALSTKVSVPRDIGGGHSTLQVQP